MAYETILYEKRDLIGFVRLNRPDVLNAMNRQMRTELDDVLKHARSDAEVRVLLLTGNGRAFSAGADLKERRQQEQTIVESLRDRRETDFRWRLWQFDKPTVAAINGFALGGGLEVALCCDFRVAVASAEFGMPEVNLGSIPGGGGTQRLPRLVGYNKAALLIMTGRRIGAGEALSMGLIDQVAPEGELLKVAESLAQELASKAPMSLSYAKEAIRKAWELSLEDGLQLESHLNALLRTTEDRQEGARAFREKRAPQFKGR
jgi:enoyl-CoA hydratase/carnithine racemase